MALWASATQGGKRVASPSITRFIASALSAAGWACPSCMLGAGGPRSSGTGITVSVSLVSPSLELLVLLDSLAVLWSVGPAEVLSSSVGLGGVALEVSLVSSRPSLWAEIDAVAAVAGRVVNDATVLPPALPVVRLLRLLPVDQAHTPLLLVWLPALPRW